MTFIKNQSGFSGKHHSLETKRKISLTKKGNSPAWNKGKEYPQIRAEKHFNWKGDKVGYDPLHAWIQRRLAKPLGCNHCGEIKPLDLASKSREYKRDLEDWLWLCRKCHAKYDDYVNKSWVTRKLKYGKSGRRVAP